MKLIVGCGYLGLRVARRWLAAGEKVCAVTRSHARASEWQANGIVPLVADVTRPETLLQLPSAETVLYAVGFDRTAGNGMREAYVEGLKNVLAALSPETARFIYVSSTGVYGSHGGDWVNEDTPCKPERENGRVCLEAEQTLTSHPLARRSIILRMAGIYGPERIPRAAALMAGEPVPAPSQGWLNLIHVDDAADAVLASEARAAPPRLYLVADGHPVERCKYYAELARLLGAPEPRFSEPPSDSPAALRSLSDKRIDASRLRRELGFMPRYGSYREGLRAIVTKL